MFPTKAHSRTRSSSNSSQALLDEKGQVGNSMNRSSNQIDDRPNLYDSGHDPSPHYQYSHSHSYTSVNTEEEVHSEGLNNANNNFYSDRKYDDNDTLTFSQTSTTFSQTTKINEDSNCLCQFLLWARLELTGFFLLLLGGTTLGLLLPPDQRLSPGYRYYSNVLGWIYFCAWSISFYPQLIENYVRKSAIGLSMDFEMLNLMGFCCYSLFTVVNHFIYKNTIVTVQDTYFALHAVLITIITIIQMIYYDGFKPHRVSYLVGSLLLVMLSSIIGYAALVLVYKNDESSKIWNWSQFLIFVSYIKLTISTVKGMPQVYLNYKRKSTEGWNIHNIICDFTGGLLSLLQLLLDCSDLHDWNQITNDPAKFGLGLVSMIFDIVFFLQHFVCYPRSKHGKDRKSPSASYNEDGEETRFWIPSGPSI